MLVKPVAVQGWDNRTFRLGEQMLVRMPSAKEYAPKIAKEQQWLPKLAPLLPLSIPEPLAMGEANEHYPYPWSIYRWIEGDNAISLPIINIENFAIDLAQFIIALQNIDIIAGPQPMPGDFAYIKNGLAYYDGEIRRAIALLKNQINADVATKIWKQALATTWQKAPVWVHGDISTGNLIIFDGKLCAVIDFGGLSIGNPACDLVIAYSFFGKEARKIFKQSLSFDISTWQRARG